MNTLAGLTGPIPRGEVEVARTQGQLVPLLGAPAEHALIDRLEDHLLDNPSVMTIHMPVTHRFTPGLYSREIFMPGPCAEHGGAILTSQCHLTDHQFVVLEGAAEVAIPGQEPVVLRAGHVGFTRAGTRRALRILEDCRWITWHPLSPEEEAARAAGVSQADLVKMVGARILGKRERADGRDIFEEYKERLAARGLPGPHDGSRMLPDPEVCPCPGES